MNKALFTACVLGTLVVSAGGVIAGLDRLDRGVRLAEVVDVDPVAADVRTPREVCRGGTTTRVEPEVACSTVYDVSEKIVGYDVRYRLGAEEGTVRMSNHPGPRIPVKNGELVTARARS